jgi:hypothetical protein
MPHACQLSSPVVRSAAGLHANQGGREIGKEFSHLVALELLLKTVLPYSFTAWTWNTFFARSMPIVVAFMVDAPVS